VIYRGGRRHITEFDCFGVLMRRDVVHVAQRHAHAVRFPTVRQRVHVVSLHAVGRRGAATNGAAPSRCGEHPGAPA
jgi:hypothetical protein